MLTQIYKLANKIPMGHCLRYNYSYNDSKKSIVIYGTSFCGPCNLAKKYFAKQALDYQFIDTEDQPYTTEVLELKKKFKWPTIPMIFVGGKFIGGYSDMMDQIKSNQLKLEQLKKMANNNRK